MELQKAELPRARKNKYESLFKEFIESGLECAKVVLGPHDNEVDAGNLFATLKTSIRRKPELNNGITVTRRKDDVYLILKK